MAKLFLLFIALIVHSEALKRSLNKIPILHKYDVFEAKIRNQPNAYNTALQVDVNVLLTPYKVNNVNNMTIMKRPVTLDTTTSEFWFISKDCKSSFCGIKARNGLSGNKSNEDTILGGNVRGTRVTAQYQIISNSTNKDVNVLAADYVDPAYGKILDSSSYGVIGLGPNSQQARYLKPSMIISLATRSAKTGNKKSASLPALFLDEIPFDLVYSQPNARLTNIASLRDDQWRFTLSFVSTYINQDSTWCTYGCEAVLDIKRTGISGPPYDINRLNSYLGADSDGSIDCYKADLLEPLIFHIHGRDYKFDAKHYIIKGDDSLSGKCQTVFKPHYSSSGEWRLGLSFLEQYVVVFDYAEKELAFLPYK